MPPPPALGQRAPLAIFLLVAVVLLVFSLLTPQDDFAQSALARNLDDLTPLRVQPPASTAGRTAPQPSPDEHSGRRLRVGLAGAGSGKGTQVVGITHAGGDALAFTVQRGETAPPSLPADPKAPSPSSSRGQTWAYVRHKLDQVATSLGDIILGVFGFDEEDWFGLGDIDGDPSGTGIEGGGLASWSESSVYVERTNSLHPSRPSSFGPHLLTEPLRGLLFPVDAVAPTDAYGCNARPVAPAPAEPAAPWVALVQRGKCPFSQKVRYAQEQGAHAVVFGDQSEDEGGISGGHGLLTPWSPDDTSDIAIPSTFVSHASYLSLLRTWNDEQEIVKHGSPTHDGVAQTDFAGRDADKAALVGLEVVLSKDEVFAWPLLDLLFMLLFLPSLLTLVTVFVQRVRVARAHKAERAPKDAVARLPVFRWGEAEKPASPDGAATTTRIVEQDEEREVGIHVPAAEATEETALLHPAAAAHAPSLVQRAVARLPASLTRRFPEWFRPSPSPAPHRAAPRPTRRYPSLTECPFCLSDFEAGDLVMELPCSHVFHAEEIETWLQQQKGICPICRMSVLAAPQPDALAPALAPPPALVPVPAHEQAVGADGAAVLVQPLRAPPSSTTTLPADAGAGTAASPVASSSSVRIEGGVGAGAALVHEEAQRGE
ncbi:hypothetical protein JCM3770_000179 [Rhodotorula araucariae]